MESIVMAGKKLQLTWANVIRDIIIIVTWVGSTSILYKQR